MLEKLEGVKDKFERVAEEIIQPEVVSDMARYTKLSKEYKELERIVNRYDLYKKKKAHLAEAKQIIDKEKDPELKDMAWLEIESLEPEIEALEEEIKLLIAPKDPNDGKNAILEIRAGTGGDEASIFAGDLYRMYTRYFETIGWKVETIDLQEGTVGGFKEIVLSVSGDEVYGNLKYESGVHRVQRVPATESQGRIHTSAASVVVLPETEDFEVELNMNDIRKDTFCSSGPGGQSVNTTYSAIRLTHIPTGIIVQCQDEKSQIRNFDKALKVLKARIYEIELKKKQDEMGATRKSLVRTGDRSEKIRTYNFPQSRLTDHRIGLTLYNLTAVMDGDIGDIIEKLKVADRAERLQAENQEA